MRITVVPGQLLTSHHMELWARLVEEEPGLISPFLRPDFTVAAAAVRDDVYVAVLEESGNTVGFFPHQRGRFLIGYPVGAPLNDLQAVIAAPGIQWDAADLIRACGLTAWKFTRLIASQKSFERFHLRRSISAYIDLSAGYDAYASEKRRAGVDVRHVSQLARKARKLEREVGPLRFEMHTADRGVLEALMKWKLLRYAPRGYRDVLAIPWARRFLERIHETQTPGFSGVLSALYVGDELVAAHMGMRSRDVAYYWFPAFNPSFARFSPGLMLLLHTAQHATGSGLRAIELGGGEYPYKNTFMNASIAVAEGTVDRFPLISRARKFRRSTEDVIRASSLLHPPARAVNRTLQGMIHLCRRAWAW